MDTNGGTYDRCASSLSGASDAYLLGVRKYGAEIYLIVFIRRELEIIVSHRLQSNKRGWRFLKFGS